MNANQLKNLIIVPVLERANLYSRSAVNLLLGTAAVESQLGHYIEQVPSGIAKGIYQCEMSTYYDIFKNFLNYDIDTRNKLIPKPTKLRRLTFLYHSLDDFKIHELSCEDNLIGNLFYSTMIARIHYYRFEEPLPIYSDIEALGKYWKKYYNTESGSGTVEKFVDCYLTYVKEI